MECCKYEKDSTPKKSFAGKGAKRNPHSRNLPEICHASNNSYMQLSTKIANLEKYNKKLKHTNKKCKLDHDSDSNNMDSS